MNRAYWNNLAAGFADAVLQVSECDTQGVISRWAQQLGGRHKHAIDFGCGPGAVTRLIAPFFASTTGVDYAAQLLAEARRLTTDESIRYERRNLEASPKPSWDLADVGFCANVLIHENTDTRRRITTHVCASIREAGHAVFIVPAYESALRTYQALSQCHEAEGMSAGRARRSLDRLATKEILSPTDGIIEIGGTPTKHYLQDEITQWLGDHGIDVESVERVEFPWSEELDDPPDWLRNSQTPWDWVAIGRRRSS